MHDNAQSVHSRRFSFPSLSSTLRSVSITVREILELEPLRKGLARVVAGESRLDRTVRWVHAAELPDIAHLLSGGELLLTTGMGIVAGAATQSRYVNDLADAQVAGIVIELGRSFNRIPTPMVETAEIRGVPLIALERETRYVEITEAVHRAIIDRQYEALRRAEDVSRNLTELILNGADVRDVVHHLSEIFGNLVVLEDEAHQVVEIAGDRSGLRGSISSWDAHSRSGHEEQERGAVHRYTEPQQCMWVRIWLRHNPWGKLHVIETDRRLEEITELLVDRAGVALALALMLERDAAHLASRARSALIAEVAASRQGTTADFLRRAHTLGSDLRRGHLAVIALEALSDQSPNSGGSSEEDRLADRVLIADDLRRAAHEQGCAALVGLHAERVIAVVAVPERPSMAEALERIIDGVGERTTDLRPLSVVAGVSGEVTPESLFRGFDEAMTALSFGRRKTGKQRVHHYGDLGAYQLLLRLAQGPELARFVESELHPMLKYDSRSRPKLLPTLTAYLAHAGRKTDTVRALGIQRRTLYARLKKIETVLGRDLEDQETRTRLTLALQGLDLLNNRRV